jgi:hypothetical protein
MSQLIKKADLELILSGAAALQARDLSHGAIQELKGITESETDDLPIEAIYELSEDVLSLPREYLDRYIQIRFPSQERQWETLRDFGAKPTVAAIAKIYGVTLVKRLEAISPKEKFDFSLALGAHPVLNYYKIETDEMWKREFFIRKLVAIEKRVNLAQINFLSDVARSIPSEKIGFRMWVNSPFFAEACKHDIESLKEKFSDYWCDYRIDFNHVY